MSSDDAPLETSGAPWFIRTLVAGLAGVLATALFLGVFHSRPRADR